jgi:Asp-tRNA(Asn)/Glu-tRNA(Gln) amidotransferase A subunit family amidase
MPARAPHSTGCSSACASGTWRSSHAARTLVTPRSRTHFSGPFIERSIDINSYEMKWPYEQYFESRGAELEKRQQTRVARAREMTPEYYAELLAEKAVMKEKARAALSEADAVLTLSASGPAPVGHAHTGSRAYLLFATFLQLPAFSLPLCSRTGMPVGAQLIGHAGRGRGSVRARELAAGV